MSICCFLYCRWYLLSLRPFQCLLLSYLTFMLDWLSTEDLWIFRFQTVWIFKFLDPFSNFLEFIFIIIMNMKIHCFSYCRWLLLSLRSFRCLLVSYLAFCWRWEIESMIRPLYRNSPFVLWCLCKFTQF